MIGRVSTQSLYEAIRNAIGRDNQRLLQLQQNLADGRDLRAPSDDPIRAGQAMWYRERTRVNEQYARSIESAQTRLEGTEAVLSSVSDLWAETRELQASGANDALGADERRALGEQLNQLLEHLVGLSNDRSSGYYTFAGRNTREAPYVVVRGDSGEITQIQANPDGIDGRQVRQLGPDVFLTINVTGADLFGEGAEAFQQLIGLRDALAQGDGEAIRSFEVPLAGFSDRFSEITASVGALVARTEALQQNVEQDRVRFEAGRSQAEDLDVAKAMVDFQEQENALQAALETGARVLNLSLLDYLP